MNIKSLRISGIMVICVNNFDDDSDGDWETLLEWNLCEWKIFAPSVLTEIIKYFASRYVVYMQTCIMDIDRDDGNAMKMVGYWNLHLYELCSESYKELECPFQFNRIMNSKTIFFNFKVDTYLYHGYNPLNSPIWRL